MCEKQMCEKRDGRRVSWWPRSFEGEMVCLVVAMLWCLDGGFTLSASAPALASPSALPLMRSALWSSLAGHSLRLLYTTDALLLTLPLL